MLRNFNASKEQQQELISEPYTLLADASQPISIDPTQERRFLAHIVTTLIFNDRIVFSDNQAIGSRNLRTLVRSNGLVRALYETGHFSLALRKQEGVESRLHEFELDRVQTVFLSEGKLDYDRGLAEIRDDIAFIEKNSKVIEWNYGDVRKNYTHNARQLLESRFSALLSNVDYAEFCRILDEENTRDKGLGRAFLQNRLQSLMEQQLSAVPPNLHQEIVDCTNAPYVSNLPATLGLNPIYPQSLQRSFQLLRGASFSMAEEGPSRAVRTRLSHAHFVEGLARLDLDDIRELRASAAIKLLRNASRGDASYSPDEVELAFEEAHISVEDRIASRFPELRRNSVVDRQRQLHRSIGARRDAGMLVAEVVAFTLSFAILPGVSTAVTHLFNRYVKGQTGDSDQLKIIDRNLRQKALQRHLRDLGKDERIEIEELTTTGSGFQKETIIT